MKNGFSKSQKLLQKFSNLHGASGFETPIREEFISQLNKISLKYKIDKLGNVLSIPSDQKAKISILIMAHMDEVGFIIQHIDEKGFIRAVPLGRWISYNVWDKEWIISNPSETLLAYSGMESPHLYNKSHDHQVNMDQLFFDTGFTKEELIKKSIHPGLPITPSSQFKVFADGNFYSGKALDDRVGLVLLLEILEWFNKSVLSTKIDLQFAATVQEEIGSRGSSLVSHSLKPDIVINFEASVAQDFPEQFNNKHQIFLGKGPSLFAFDDSMVPDQDLLHSLVNCAEQNGIPFQWEVEDSYGEDAAKLQTSWQGVSAINIGIPIRYLHSHHSVMLKHDYDALFKLITCFLDSFVNENKD